MVAFYRSGVRTFAPKVIFRCEIQNGLFGFLSAIRRKGDHCPLTSWARCDMMGMMKATKEERMKAIIVTRWEKTERPDHLGALPRLLVSLSPLQRDGSYGCTSVGEGGLVPPGTMVQKQGGDGCTR